MCTLALALPRQISVAHRWFLPAHVKPTPRQSFSFFNLVALRRAMRSEMQPVQETDTVQNSLLALVPDRKQLEQERLRRAAARERQTSTRKRPRSASSEREHDTLPSEPLHKYRMSESQRYVPIEAKDRFWHGAIKVGSRLAD